MYDIVMATQKYGAEYLSRLDYTLYIIMHSFCLIVFR